MDKIEIFEKIKANNAEIQAIMEKGERETRSLTSEEINKITDLKSQNIGLNSNIEKIKTNETRSQGEKFSFIRSLNQIVNNQALDGIAKEVIEEGNKILRNSGFAGSGQLVVPTKYLRSAITLADNADAITGTVVDKVNVIQDALIFNKLGANYGTYTSEFVLPTMSQSTAVWEGENDDNTDGAGTLTSVKLSPKRLSAYIDVSKKFIAMDNSSAEQVIVNDLVSAISRAIEKTVLGKVSGSTTQPVGLFYSTPTISGSTSFANVVTVEQKLFEKNSTTNKLAWVVNPKVKTLFRTTGKLTNGTNAIMEDSNTAVSYPLYVSNYVASGLQTGGDEYGAVLADWSQLFIAQFGDAIDLTIDPYTQSTKSMVRITVDFYADAAFRNSAYYQTASFK